MELDRFGRTPWSPRTLGLFTNPGRTDRSGSGASCLPDDGGRRIFHGRSSVITDGSTTSGKETISYETSDDALSRCNSCSGWRLCGRHDYRANASPTRNAIWGFLPKHSKRYMSDLE